MPNWCSCKLQISGPKEDLSLFLEPTKNDNQFSLSKYVPVPEELSNIINGSVTIDDEQYYVW